MFMIEYALLAIALLVITTHISNSSYNFHKNDCRFRGHNTTGYRKDFNYKMIFIMQSPLSAMHYHPGLESVCVAPSIPMPKLCFVSCLASLHLQKATIKKTGANLQHAKIYWHTSVSKTFTCEMSFCRDTHQLLDSLDTFILK